jgi:arogenate dehydrogenase (NADP+)
MNKDLKIGIVGLGLIGGSVFKALCALKYNIIAVSLSDKTIEKAKKYCINVSKNLSSLKNCDIIFVCTPMNKTVEILNELNNILPSNVIVSDVCSLKRFINQKYNFKFIPAHPMAGSEFSGFDASFQTLFQNAKWIITPLENTVQTDIEKLKNIIEVLGANVVFSSPEEHDEAVSLISHMPMLISQAIFKTASTNELALKLASSGFRDMTRLVMSNEEMAKDIINLNSDNIQNSLLSLYFAIGELLNKDYQSQIKKIKIQREKMYSDGKNILQ